MSIIRIVRRRCNDSGSQKNARAHDGILPVAHAIEGGASTAL